MSISIGAKNWDIKSPNKLRVQKLAEETGLSKIVSAVLCSKGIENAEQALSYVNKDDCELYSPFLFKDMEKAASRLNKAIENGEKICIFGDYDVDGVSATALLKSYLNNRGYNNHMHYIPERLTEGYGMNMKAIERLCDEGVKLIITVDNGISASNEINYAYKLGMEVIVTDHHECRSEIPRCEAVINPKYINSGYPFQYLAGVGVAYKLVCAAEMLNGSDDLNDNKYIELVTLGTIADMMPLEGENRTLVSYGLHTMNNGACTGIEALCDASSAEKQKQSKKTINSNTISFTLAPRINAAGRVGDTEDALRLLATEDIGEAQHLSDRLCMLNSRRQSIENAIFIEACEKIEKEHDFSRDKVIVVESENWNHGVVGIVSSKITERYRLPSILISVENGEGKGSARSIKGFNINEAIANSREKLIKFGGHELAAGLSIKQENIDVFRKEINDFARDRITDDMLYSVCEIDAEIDAVDINVKNAQQLSLLEPYGCGNPQPVFCLRDVSIAEIVPIGSNKHLKLILSKDGLYFTALLFGTSPDDFFLREGENADFAFNLDINDFAGKRSAQLMIKDIRLCRNDRDATSNALLAYINGVNGIVCKREDIPDVAKMRVFFSWLQKVSGYYSGGVNIFLFVRKCNEETQNDFSIESVLYMLTIFSEMKLINFKRSTSGFVEFSMLKCTSKVNIEASETLMTLKECAE